MAVEGSLRLLPALVPRGADVAEGALPLTATHLLRQAFKFLGERYGWGSSYDTRDCSGFVSEVYRSFGILLPRNSGDQAMSPALNRTEFDAASSHAARLAAMQTLDVGDLIYIPGHVMLVIGSERGSPVVIHDSAGVTYRDADGTLVRQVLNGVAVTPFRLMLTDTGEPYLDRIQSIVRMRPVQR